LQRIQVYGTRWCGNSIRALKLLNDRKVEFDWIDIDQNPDGEKLVKEINQGFRSVPTIVFPDQTILVEPSNQELIDKLTASGLLG